jgi:hypothetical protein
MWGTLWRPQFCSIRSAIHAGAYMRTADGFEVNFIVRCLEGGEELIQVCSDLDEVDTKERELRALIAAGRERPGVGLRLISLEPEAPHDLRQASFGNQLRIGF